MSKLVSIRRLFFLFVIILLGCSGESSQDGGSQKDYATSLSVSSASGFSSSGTQGGPFTPSSYSCTLSNPGSSAINWSAASSQSWVSLSSSIGTLAAGGSTTVTVSLNTNANSLTASQTPYTGSVSFTNTTNGNGNTSRAVSLTVNAAASLSVNSASGFSSSGVQGGPFTPSSYTYTLSNPGTTAINWTAASSQKWMSLSSAIGTLAAGSSTTLTVSINSNANSLPISQTPYTGSVSFTNTTNGNGNTSRAVSLIVNAIELQDDGDSWIVSYPVTNGTAEFTLNKIPFSDGGIFKQFVSMVKYNDVQLTDIPFWGGVSGLVLIEAQESEWTSEIEIYTPYEIVVKYINAYYTVRLSFIDHIPLMKITVDYTAPWDLASFNIRFNFWQAIGGSYNPNNRVIVPQGEDGYYVIDGQAEGIHYFPSNEYWSLRMGEQNTPYQNITVGFVYKDDSIVQQITEFNEKPLTWGDWAMGQDLYLDTNNQFEDSFDVVRYGLDKIKDNIYYIYQEDEAGLYYSWMDTSGKRVTLYEGDKYHYEVYFWVGEDNWVGQYGKNNDSEYRFMVDRYQDIFD